MNLTARLLPSSKSSIRRALAVVAAAVPLLAGASAYAVLSDRVAIDLTTHAQTVVFNWASNPSSQATSVPLTFSPTTRSAYSQSAPLPLPCDVSFLAIGMSFQNVGSDAFYAEQAGTVAVRGDEHNLLTNVFGQTEPLAPLNYALQPGAVGTGGFIFIAQPPLYDFTTEQFPANVPLKLRMLVRPFSSTAYDTSRGGYALSGLLSESPIYNNAWTVWVQRTCP